MRVRHIHWSWRNGPQITDLELDAVTNELHLANANEPETAIIRLQLHDDLIVLTTHADNDIQATREAQR